MKRWNWFKRVWFCNVLILYLVLYLFHKIFLTVSSSLNLEEMNEENLFRQKCLLFTVRKRKTRQNGNVWDLMYFCISYCFETYCNSSIFSNFLEQFENRLSTFHVILRIVNTHLYQAFRRKQTRLARKNVAPLHIMRLGMQL